MTPLDIFKWVSRLSWLIFILLIIGYFKTPPAFFVTFTFFVKVFIALFLIYRFNSYRTKITFTELDRKIAFSAGCFILLFSFTDYVAVFTNELKSFVSKIELKLLGSI